MQTELTRRDYEDFLLRAYFGRKYLCQPLAACIDRSYKDFNRTIHGIGNLPEGATFYETVSTWLAEEVRALASQSSTTTQEFFDIWHEGVCTALIDKYNAIKDKYREIKLPTFHVGQAQKWINMTFKYIFTFGEKRIPGFFPIYGYCHVPIDNIVLERLTPLGFCNLTPWSRIDDYNKYLSAQKWIRTNFTIPPLDVEFYAWQKRDCDLRSMMGQR